MNLMDSAGKLMKGLSAAGKAVVDEAVRATDPIPEPEPPAVPPTASKPALPPANQAKPAG